MYSSVTVSCCCFGSTNYLFENKLFTRHINEYIFEVLKKKTLSPPPPKETTTAHICFYHYEKILNKFAVLLPFKTLITSRKNSSSLVKMASNITWTLSDKFQNSYVQKYAYVISPCKHTLLWNRHKNEESSIF